MTRAEFGIEGSRYNVKITGHAMFSPEGVPDIVCASCSTLTYLLLQQLLKAENEGMLVELKHDTQDGAFYAQFTTQKSAKREIDTVLDVISDGFLMLQAQYPENVALKWGEIERKT